MQAILSKRVAVATAQDDSVSVAVGADGTVRHWERLGSNRPTDPDRLVAMVLELIATAHRAAYDAACAGQSAEPACETPHEAIDPAAAALSPPTAFNGAVSYEEWHDKNWGSRIED